MGKSRLSIMQTAETHSAVLLIDSVLQENYEFFKFTLMNEEFADGPIILTIQNGQAVYAYDENDCPDKFGESPLLPLHIYHKQFKSFLKLLAIGQGVEFIELDMHNLDPEISYIEILENLNNQTES